MRDRIMTKEIQLTKGYVSLVDDESYSLVSSYKWYAQTNKSGIVYAVTFIRNASGKWDAVLMHRMLMDIRDSKVQVDHINGDGRDNRLANLRICTSAQNAMNRRTQKNSTSGVGGVSWHKRDRKWQAHITVNRKKIYVGGFGTLEEAATARQAAAIQHYGQFARVE